MPIIPDDEFLWDKWMYSVLRESYDHGYATVADITELYWTDVITIEFHGNLYELVD
jgi:hypothetical protein